MITVIIITFFNIIIMIIVVYYCRASLFVGRYLPDGCLPFTVFITVDVHSELLWFSLLHYSLVILRGR